MLTVAPVGNNLVLETACVGNTEVVLKTRDQKLCALYRLGN
jgi:hypothetical protein